MYRISRLAKTEVQRGILELVFVVICLVFISAGCIFEAESNGTEPGFGSFHQTLYFIVVTLSTVGYGDMSPTTEIGRVAIMFIIMTGLVVVPLQTSRVVELVAIQRKYMDSYIASHDRRKHVVIAGHLSSSEILSFVKEFYHENHIGANANEKFKNIVLLSPHDPDPNLEAILDISSLPPGAIKYLKGCLTDESSLIRAHLAEADAIFLLADKFAKASADQDAQNILALIVMLRYLMSETMQELSVASPRSEAVPSGGYKVRTRCYIQIMDTKNEERLELLPFPDMRCSVGLHSLKMRILAFGSACPGGLALLHNLTRSFAYNEGAMRDFSTSFHAQEQGTAFEAYINGVDNEVRETT